MRNARLWLALFGVVVLAMALAQPLMRFVETSSLWLDYPYTRPGSEGLVLYETLLLKHKGNIYTPITPQSFISGPYPPVYYWLASLLLPGALPDFSESSKVTSILQPGRVISLVSAVVAATLLALLVVIEGEYFVRRRRVALWAALGGTVGGVLFLTLPQTLVWATRFRGDMLMIALTAAGLVCVAAGAHVRGDGRWILLTLGAVFFALAFFTKQTALAGPAASAIYMLLRDWRSGLRWCALMLALAVVPFVVIDIVTGHWFYLKMVVYHSLPISRTIFTRLLHYAFWDEQWPLILLATAYSAHRLTGFWRNSIQNPILVPLFVLAALLSLPLGGVVGADHNHLLLPGLAVCTGVGSLLAWILTSATMWSTARFAVVYGSTILLVTVYALFTSTPSAAAYGPDFYYPTPEEQEQMRKIAFYIHETPGGPFYADDVGILALTGKETPYDDAFTMTALANGGRWDEATLRDMLSEGKFAKLVLSCDVPATLSQEGDSGGRLCRPDVFTPGVLDAINSRYKILFRDVLFTYVPK